MSFWTDIKSNLTVSHVVIFVLALAFVNSTWVHIGGMGGGDCDTSKLDKQIEDLTNEKGWLQANLTQAKADVAAFQSNQTGPCDCGDKLYNQSELDAALAEVQSDLDECQNETGVSAEIGTFTDDEMKDWIAGTLKLQKTAVNSFELFGSTEEALDYLSESYTYSSGHDLMWNLDELSYALADAHKTERSDVRAIFFGKNDVFIVLPSETNVAIPEFYVLDETDDEFEFVLYDEDKTVNVIAMDKLTKAPKK